MAAQRKNTGSDSSDDLFESHIAQEATPRILVVDDDTHNRNLLAATFKSEGFSVKLAEDGETGLALVSAYEPSVILLDRVMPGMGGLETLRRMIPLVAGAPIIMLTSHGSVQDAVEAVKAGAFDFLERPINTDKLILTVRHALDRRRLEKEVSTLLKRLDSADAMKALSMTSSNAMRHVLNQIEQVASTGVNILIQGETGTGKELVARAIHQQSARRAKPFVPIDCGALPETLLETELFGHEKGTFTGAVGHRMGHLVAGQSGTIFLDEIGNMPLLLQPKLLRVIQEKVVQPLGSTKSISLDVRFVFASNARLPDQIASGQFRSDLYYRASEFTINLPPLRERREDIVPIASKFVEEASVEMRRPKMGIASSAADLLKKYNWPGNIRELRNVMRRATLISQSLEITPEDLGELQGTNVSVTTLSIPLAGRETASLKAVSDAASAAAERMMIVDALRATGGHKGKTAERLQIDPKTLLTKIKLYGIGDSDS